MRCGDQAARKGTVMKKLKKLLILVMIVVFALSASACSIVDYSKAVQLFLNEDYASARSAFEALGDYKDSKTLIKRCSYEIARNSYDNGDYESAITQFEALGSYKNSEELMANAQNILMKDKVVGNWRADDIDVTEYFNGLLKEAAAANSYGDLSEYVSLESCTATVTMQLTDSGTITLNVSTGTTAESFVEALTAAMNEYVTAYYTKAAEDNQTTLEDLLAANSFTSVDDLFKSENNMTIEEYCAANFVADNYSVELAPWSSGVFALENGTVTVYHGEDSETLDYSEDDDTITLHTDGTALPADIVLTRG